MKKIYEYCGHAVVEDEELLWEANNQFRIWNNEMRELVILAREGSTSAFLQILTALECGNEKIPKEPHAELIQIAATLLHDGDIEATLSPRSIARATIAHLLRVPETDEVQQLIESNMLMH